MARYKPNHVDFGKFLVSERVHRVAVAAAEDIAADAKEKGRRGNDAGPHYVDQYQVNHAAPPVDIAPGGPRASADVFNDNIQATRDEFGNSRNPKVRPLGKAGDKYHTPKGTGGRV